MDLVLRGWHFPLMIGGIKQSSSQRSLIGRDQSHLPLLPRVTGSEQVIAKFAIAMRELFVASTKMEIQSAAFMVELLALQLD